jgi:hypothetical protein
MRRFAIMWLSFSLSMPLAHAAAVPVLVELFTSEGCSDCPSADRLLEELGRSQPAAGAQVIVLSEHVDYWDRLGWKDPFSAHFFSERQENYARRFHLETVYTPQMVVDGSAEFVGSDGKRAVSAITAAARTPKVTVRITAVSGPVVRVEAGPQDRAAGVYLAIVEKDGGSQVLRGENQGRHLHHVNIVSRIESLGRSVAGAAFEKEIAVREATEPGYRLVVFLQDGDNGPIRGASVLENGESAETERQLGGK